MKHFQPDVQTTLETSRRLKILRSMLLQSLNEGLHILLVNQKRITMRACPAIFPSYVEDLQLTNHVLHWAAIFTASSHLTRHLNCTVTIAKFEWHKRHFYQTWLLWRSYEIGGPCCLIMDTYSNRRPKLQLLLDVLKSTNQSIFSTLRHLVHDRSGSTVCMSKHCK